MKFAKSELKEFLEEKVKAFNTPEFIELDPISIPHRFSLKEDIEISGFLAATIAWGNRKSIVKNANKMMDLMGNSPYDFVMDHSDKNLEPLQDFVHRTFNGKDFTGFINGLEYIYKNQGGLEAVFTEYQQPENYSRQFHSLKKYFLKQNTFLARKNTLAIHLKVLQQKELICFCGG